MRVISEFESSDKIDSAEDVFNSLEDKYDINKINCSELIPMGIKLSVRSELRLQVLISLNDHDFLNHEFSEDVINCIKQYLSLNDEMKISNLKIHRIPEYADWDKKYLVSIGVDEGGKVSYVKNILRDISLPLDKTESWDTVFRRNMNTKFPWSFRSEIVIIFKSIEIKKSKISRFANFAKNIINSRWA